MNSHLDVIIIGAGAAGLMCAIEAGKRGRQVVVFDHANKPGKKILMSGGGRCNFTNLDVSADKFLSQNPHFCKSALSQYTQWDFIDLVQRHQIAYHEKTLGQLFCDGKSHEIVTMLLSECERANAQIHLQHVVSDIRAREQGGYSLWVNDVALSCDSLVIASGGLSIPTMGASPFGYQVAEQFGMKIIPTRAGLVPFTLHAADKQRFSPLSGVSVMANAHNKQIAFQENILFTHRGLSGPAVLQLSSYWQPGESIELMLRPDLDLPRVLQEAQQMFADKQVKTILSQHYPKRLLDILLDETLAQCALKQLTPATLEAIVQQLQHFTLSPNGTEGYRTAEVTLGGVDVNAISSKTLEANDYPGLYFIGEVLDVTGWLGGYNFQWAWSSGWVAGQCA